MDHLASINVMEIIIREKLNELGTQLPLTCNCETCLEDVFTLTINKFPAQYASRAEGVAFIKSNLTDLQYQVGIVSELIKSCQIVSNSPSHK